MLQDIPQQQLLPNRSIPGPKRYDRETSNGAPPLLARRVIRTYSAGSSVAFSIRETQMGGLLATGSETAHTDVLAKDLTNPPVGQSCSEIWSRSARAVPASSAHFERTELEVFLDTDIQSHAELASSAFLPVPQHQNCSCSNAVKYVNVEHLGHSSGCCLSLTADVLDGNSYEISNDRNFNYDVVPSITNIRLQSGGISCPAQPQDLHNSHQN